MRPDQAEFLLCFLLPQLISEQSVTKKILEALPPEKGDYQPQADSRSALKLAWHLAVVEIWFLDAVIGRHFREPAPMPAEVKTGRDVAEWYEENCRKRLPLLKMLTGEDLATPVNFIDLRNDPAVAYVNIAIRHSVHHRGQLSTYLRGMGAKVPAIYVESADEPYPAPGIQHTPPAF